jgi:hypothetical protein
MPSENYSNGSNHSGATAIPKPDDAASPITPRSSTSGGEEGITSPPYWVQSHRRSVSNISVESIQAGAITLQDNTDGIDGKNEVCWAKGVHIVDHVVVNSSRTGIGAFVVWNITVETLSVSIISR